jgi:TatD DNase family protein
MIELPEFFYNVDVHTHVPADNAIVNITPFGNGDPFMSACQYYSVGIHPWLADKADTASIAKLRTLAADSRVVAVGEAGLDARRGPELSKQMPVFTEQIALAEAVQKPLIIHAVATFGEIIRLKREFKPSVPWIVHGFRGKPQLAQELVHHGLYISLGLRHNESVPGAVPAHMLLHETDAV